MLMYQQPSQSLGAVSFRSRDTRLRPVPVRRGPPRSRAQLGYLGAGDTGAAKQGAAKGASMGATIGSAVPVIGTAIGAVVGAVVGALAGILGKKDRDKIAWGQYLQGAGKAPGRAYDELPFELAWQGMQEKYAPWKQWQVRPGESGYELGIVDLIVRGAREGKLTTASTVLDTANYVFSQLEAHKPGFMSFLGNPGVRQIHVDFIDRVIAGLQVGATYNNARRAHTTLIDELQKAGVAVKQVESEAPIATSVTVPVATPAPAPKPSPTPAPVPAGQLPPGVQVGAQLGFAPNGSPVWNASDGKMYLRTSTGFYPYSGPVAATPPNAPTTAVPTTALPQPGLQQPQPIPPATADNTRALIDALLAQGSSTQQAFQAALQSLSSQGVQPTPQIQQAVAEEVKTQAAEKAGFSWPIVAGVGVGVTLLAFVALSRRRRSKT